MITLRYRHCGLCNLSNNITDHMHIPSTTTQTNERTTIKMSLPFTILPCNTYGILECTRHERGQVEITLSRAHISPAASGIFCHAHSPWNTAYLKRDELNRSERILHAAAITVRQVAAYLAKETAAAAPIVDIFLKINVKAFIVWYGSIDRDSDVTPRIAALLRDLDDAAALVGECGGYRPDIKFVRRVPGNVREATGDLTMRVLHQRLSSKSLLKTFV